MGKVLSTFTNGFAGAVSRSVDNIIIALKNASAGDLPFGTPVFLKAGENACLAFDAETSEAKGFLGFTVRVPDKTPETYGSNEGRFNAGDIAEVLVRGSVVLQFEGSAQPGDSVYIRKADGALVTAAGAQGSTLQLPNVTVRKLSDSADCAEAVITKRNIL